jgi:hypothetical protein
MDKILTYVLNGALDSNDRKAVTFLISELLDTLIDDYNFERIQKRASDLLVDLDGEYLGISDIDRNKCIDIIGRNYPHITMESIELLSFNNITMEVRFSYSTEGYTYKNISTISAFDYPEILNPRNN